ncbi:MAG: hypothetical protein INR71_14050, partial [Terriglobus roseus]|nr:hypothetical protein [Terriglobus roseus]
MRVHEITPQTPLGSHLPFPMNVNAPQDASPRQTFQPTSPDSSESPSKDVRRRATLPSLMLSQGDLAALTSIWQEDVRDGAADAGRTPTPDIGMAITSMGGYASNRRSRSADALKELARAQEQTGQPVGAHSRAGSRAAEIEYWRASYAPATRTRNLSPQRESFPEKKKSVESVEGMSMKTTPDPAISGCFNEKRQALGRQAAVDQRQIYERPSVDSHRDIHSSGQVTNGDSSFGSVRGHTRNFSRPAANEVVTPERDGVEDRLSRLEQWVRRLQDVDRQSAIVLGDHSGSPRRVKSFTHNRFDTLPQTKGASHGPGLPSHTPMEDTPPSSAHGLQPKDHNGPSNMPQYGWPQDDARFPTNEINADSPNYLQGSRGTQLSQDQAAGSAVGGFDFAYQQRPQTSHAVPSSLPSPNMYDHLAPLYAALHYERSKRKEFEVQMAQMQQQLAELTQMARSRRREGVQPNGSVQHDRAYRRGAPTYMAHSPGYDEFGDGRYSNASSDDQGAVMHGQRSRFSGLDYDSEADEADDGDMGAGAEDDDAGVDIHRGRTRFYP